MVAIPSLGISLDARSCISEGGKGATSRSDHLEDDRSLPGIPLHSFLSGISGSFPSLRHASVAASVP